MVQNEVTFPYMVKVVYHFNELNWHLIKNQHNQKINNMTIKHLHKKLTKFYRVFPKSKRYLREHQRFGNRQKLCHYPKLKNLFFG